MAMSAARAATRVAARELRSLARTTADHKVAPATLGQLSDRNGAPRLVHFCV